MNVVARLKGKALTHSSHSSLNSLDKESTSGSALSRGLSQAMSRGSSKVTNTITSSLLSSRNASKRAQTCLKATWNGQVIALSENCVVYLGRYFFPRADIQEEALSPGDYANQDERMGKLNYLNVTVDGKVNDNAAYFIHEPIPQTQHIKYEYVAFWKGILVDPIQ